MIEWYGVESSNLKQIGYDRETEQMRVRFKSGAEYDYWHVPGTVFADFVDAESAGKYLNSEIKPKSIYNIVAKEEGEIEENNSPD